jgi:hypothetical protein
MGNLGSSELLSLAEALAAITAEAVAASVVQEKKA